MGGSAEKQDVPGLIHRGHAIPLDLDRDDMSADKLWWAGDMVEAITLRIGVDQRHPRPRPDAPGNGHRHRRSGDQV